MPTARQHSYRVSWPTPRSPGCASRADRDPVTRGCSAVQLISLQRCTRGSRPHSAIVDRPPRGTSDTCSQSPVGSHGQRLSIWFSWAATSADMSCTHEIYCASVHLSEEPVRTTGFGQPDWPTPNRYSRLPFRNPTEFGCRPVGSEHPQAAPGCTPSTSTRVFGPAPSEAFTPACLAYPSGAKLLDQARPGVGKAGFALSRRCRAESACSARALHERRRARPVRHPPLRTTDQPSLTARRGDAYRVR